MARTFNLADLFEVVAGAVPDRTAFVCGSQQLSYRALDQRATQLASALRKQGIQRGDNVGIALYNSAAYLEAFLACCKIGAAPANINYRYVAEELKYLYTSLDLKAVFYNHDAALDVAQAAAGAPVLQWRIEAGGSGTASNGALDYETLLATGDTVLDDPQRSDNDLYLLCTGGTTGMPKGVMWPHKSLFMGALGGGGIYFRAPPIEAPEALTQMVLNGPPLRYFAIAPMMHGAAMWSSLISFYAGHTVVVNDQAHFNPEHIWDIIVRDGVNIMAVVGDAMAQPLVKALEAHPGRWDLSKLMVIGNGGAPLSARLKGRFTELVPHAVINDGIGSSETGVVGGGSNPTTGEGLIVIPARPDLAVVDEHLRIVTGTGARGTLARSGYTPIGYYGDPKKTASTFVTIDGQLWVLSGDQVRIDEQGNLVVMGRGSQCINTGGEKVFPEEVESAARHYPAVHDVLVVGVPDERWGQKVVAVVEPTPGHTFDLAEFQRVCRQHLSGYKVPKAVYLTEQVKRSPAGKADYRWALQHATQAHPLS